MPTLTFLGVENPLGVLGLKVKGVFSTDADDSLTPIKKSPIGTVEIGKEKYAAADQRNKYLNRESTFQAQKSNDIQKMVADTIENRKFLVSTLGSKGKFPGLRVSVASSFTSMMKYLENYGNANHADNFDTVIVYGHGMPGRISMGLGQLAIGDALPFGEEKYKIRKEMRETYGLDKPSKDGEKPGVRRVRDLKLSNLDIWGARFDLPPRMPGAHPVFIPNATTQFFHLFLMGCEVGQPPKGAHKLATLQNKAAKALANVMGISVCVSAPDKTIKEDHLADLLKRLPKIRGKCSQGEPYQIDADDEISLLSSTAT